MLSEKASLSRSEKQLGQLFVHIRKICRWPGLRQYHSLVSNLRFEQQFRLKKLGRHQKIIGEDICFFDRNISEFLQNSSSIILSPFICAENEIRRYEFLFCNYTTVQRKENVLRLRSYFLWHHIFSKKYYICVLYIVWEFHWKLYTEKLKCK